MKGEISRERLYFTESHWVNRPEINLSGWPINRKGQRLGRINAGGTNKVKKMLVRLAKEGLK